MFFKKAVITVCSFMMMAVNAANFTVANTSDQPINVGVQVPAKTVACISLMPITQLKKMTQQELQEELIKAVIRDSVDDIKAIVIAGADVNHEYTITKTTALFFAIKNNKKKSATVLMKLGANVHENIRYTNIYFNDKQMWQFIRKTPNFKDHAIYIVCHNAKLFHDDYKGFRAVLEDCIAVELNINDIWSHYLKDILQIDKPIYSSNLQAFLDLGADPNFVINLHSQYTATPLTIVIALGDAEQAEILLSYGANVNMQADTWGYGLMPPLSFALIIGNKLPIAEVLIANGAKL